MGGKVIDVEFLMAFNPLTDSPMSDMLYMQVEDFVQVNFLLCYCKGSPSQYDLFLLRYTVGSLFFFSSQCFWVQELNLKFLQEFNIIRMSGFLVAY